MPCSKILPTLAMALLAAVRVSVAEMLATRSPTEIMCLVDVQVAAARIDALFSRFVAGCDLNGKQSRLASNKPQNILKQFPSYHPRVASLHTCVRELQEACEALGSPCIHPSTAKYLAAAVVLISAPHTTACMTHTYS